MQQTLTSNSYKPIIHKKDIEKLIHTGEQVSENEARVLSKGKETKTYSHQLPENILKNAKLIDDKLAEITVCDPAVGSGAFPVGMMSEIVKTRNVLTTFVTQSSKSEKEHKQDTCATYNFKRQCIEHSLYGVDIDPGAVEIAKLRLWLSLVVDEDDIKNIKPLPNLDYKIVCGNSLLGLNTTVYNLGYVGYESILTISNVEINPIPEPATLLLLGSGLIRTGKDSKKACNVKEFVLEFVSILDKLLGKCYRGYHLLLLSFGHLK